MNINPACIGHLPASNSSSLVILFCFILAVSPAVANNNTQQQNGQTLQTHIESDTLTINKNTHQSTFIGKVHLNRKQLTIDADKIIVIQSPASAKEKAYIKLIKAFGKPVQLRDTDKQGKKIHAQANTIIYDHKEDQITLQGNAILQSGQDQFSSRIIWYNRKTSEMRAGKITTPGKLKGSRVKILLSEEHDAE